MSEAGLWYRRMDIDDIDQVMMVETSVYTYPWTKQIFHDCIRVGYDCWLALVEAKIVGHAVISVAAGESHILNISVHEDYQCRGIGRQFIEFLVNIARQKQASVIMLEVRPSNSAAIHCYHAAGFNEIGFRKDYYPASNGREDALLFARDIG